MSPVYIIERIMGTYGTYVCYASATFDTAFEELKRLDKENPRLVFELSKWVGRDRLIERTTAR